MADLINAANWDSLKKQVSLEEVVKAVNSYRQNKESHKKYNARRNAILAKAKELGITAD